MDKYKTSELGKALKQVYRGKLTVKDSVALAQKEIGTVFEKKNLPIEKDTDTGVYGDVVGVCPVCGNTVVKGKYGYGCLGYKEGCSFRFGSYICKRPISISNARLLLSEGKTSLIEGFLSKNGNRFNARLILNQEKKVVFDFSK